MALRLAIILATIAIFLAGTPSAMAHAEQVSAGRGTAFGKEPFAFVVWGESPNWVVALQGYGERDDGHVRYVQVKPYEIWTGGGTPPQKYQETFTIQQVTCLHGTISGRSVKLAVSAVCKLVYPNQPSIMGDKPEDFVRAIMQHGQYRFGWDDKKETISWRYGYPVGAGLKG